mmetsp:Transcript_42210/g.92013  ORF Transcript_42210/g.92013 Transcript_42210/m.92013 type:complete len:139 (+) Transcript_42210:407-823(+)
MMDIGIDESEDDWTTHSLICLYKGICIHYFNAITKEYLKYLKVLGCKPGKPSHVHVISKGQEKWASGPMIGQTNFFVDPRRSTHHISYVTLLLSDRGQQPASHPNRLCKKRSKEDTTKISEQRRYLFQHVYKTAQSDL